MDNRLVDYFAVVGYDFDNEDKEDSLRGKVVSRIPETDWKDQPFISGIELFCQPGGWRLSEEKQPVTFFVSVLTDEAGKQQYCAVLSFSEPIRAHSPSHSNRTLRKERTKSNDSNVVENGMSMDYSHGDELIDEDMCRVENEDLGYVSELASVSRDSKTDSKYAPKCLVLLSRIHDFKILKNSLGIIYSVYIESRSHSIENMIAKLLLVQVPPPGSSQLKFSIGPSDLQVLQTPRNLQLPITRSCVSMLLRQLDIAAIYISERNTDAVLEMRYSSVDSCLTGYGILNVLNILSAALIDQKLLFYSCSYVRLTEACNALTALMYPFKYSYPYIPILPRHLAECTSSPTPFLFGVHSSLKSDLNDVFDVVTVDLDGGVISIPESVTLPAIPEPYYTSVVEALTKVLCPDLVVADWAYPPDHVKSSEPERLDKEIRAIFLRMFCQILMGYRTCLQVCRIHPKPIIRFKKEQYLTMRGFDVTTTSSNEFIPKLIDSQAFSLFVQDNGPPYRCLHKFDLVVSETPKLDHSDIDDVYKALKHIKELASDLYMNNVEEVLLLKCSCLRSCFLSDTCQEELSECRAQEKENPNHMPLNERIPKPPESAYTRTTQRRFPKLSATAVQAFMEENRATAERQRNFKPKKPVRKRVPEGTRPVSYNTGALGTSARRLEVLKNCLTFIFESRTLEIKKIFQAVIRAMKSRAVRHAMAQELIPYSKHHALLDNQQFDYVARLLNSALQDSSGQLDEYTLAADFLPLVTSFHRKLSLTVTQFMYSEVQEHPVWSSSAFWQNAFFDDIQDEIQHLYRDCFQNEKLAARLQSPRSRTGSPIHSPSNTGTDFSSNISRHSSLKHFTGSRRDNQICMEIAAIQLEEWDSKTSAEQREISSAEESVVYSQAMHNAQRMVFMLVPLDSSRVNRAKFLRYAACEENSSNSYFTNSANGSVNGSVYDEQFDDPSEGANEVSNKVSRFISRFVDRVCTEASITNNHTKALLDKIPTLVRMQMESLQDVCLESRRLPPIMKQKLLQPRLLPGESPLLHKAMRAFLSYDGRATATGGDIGGPALLPAEGALFLTTYRVIFIGTPCDALAAEQVVIRSFPVSSLFKIKSFKVHDYPHIAEIDKTLQDGIQLRSATFQLLLLAFDDEVGPEKQEFFHKKIHELRYPSTIEGAFAISSLTADNQVKRNHSNRSLGIAGDNLSSSTAKMSSAKTFYKQAKRKAGLDKPNRLTKLIGPDSKSRTLYTSPNFATPGSTSTLGRMPAIDEAMTKTLSDKDTMNRLFQRSCEGDYKRMGFVGITGTKYRLSRVNRLFSVCRSYPVCVVVPMSVLDDQIKSLAHCHHQARFPAAVWLHPITKAVLLRSSAIKSRTGNSLFKHGQQKLSDEGTAGSSSEEEKFLLRIASLATHQGRSSSALFRPESVISLSSLDSESGIVPSPTLSLSGTSSLSSSVRSSRGAKKWGTLNKANGKMTLDPANYSPKINSRTSSVGLPANGTITQAALLQAMARRAQLYIFGDKNQIKNLRHEQQGKVMFVPLELADPKQIRVSFKSFIKSCLPADPPTVSSSQQLQDTISSSSYRKEVQESLWMDQVSQLIQAAGSIVDVMDIQGASVMISMDDGSDVVPQISSLSQVLMDPHYRTLDGFRVLIEKEWLSFGHRFSHRNRFNDIESSGFTPVFLMFLDAVYQVHQQFPMSFEFNETYLEVLAYHSMSNRFTTFLLDSDYERLEAGILFEKKTRQRSSQSSTSPDGASPKTRQIRSFWEYIYSAHKHSPAFFNPLYCPSHLTSQILRPVSSLCRLKVWPYYVREALGEGPPYDGLLGELTTGTSHNEQEATETSEAWGGATGRRLLNGCYDNIADAQPDSIKMLLKKIEGLQGELGVQIDSWTSTWKAMSSTSPLVDNLPDTIVQARREVRSLNKFTTVDVIQKNLESTESSFAIPNRMRAMSTLITSSIAPRSTQKTPVPKRAVREGSLVSESSNYTSESDAVSLHEQYDVPAVIPLFRTSTMEVRTFEGNLWKQGALMKAWKLRFFVLDTTKHELRQYESRAEFSTKNIIDLKDLESVQRIDYITSPPKGVAENSYFEVKIAKRTYTFIAENENAAKVWVEHLEAALQ